ncbi:hypothetical protein [Rufibacter sp. LB8]|nr:hypothetical protein [Rufibacter sp. LB8]
MKAKTHLLKKDVQPLTFHKMRTLPFSLLFCLLLISALFFPACGLKETEKPKAHSSFTLISIGQADSATALNKGRGISRYIYANLNTDSVFYYQSINSGYGYHHIPKTQPSRAGIIQGFSKDSTIIKFLQRSKSMLGRPKIEYSSERGLRENSPYVLIIEEGTQQ